MMPTIVLALIGAAIALMGTACCAMSLFHARRAKRNADICHEALMELRRLRGLK